MLRGILPAPGAYALDERREAVHHIEKFTLSNCGAFRRLPREGPADRASPARTLWHVV